MSIQSMHDVHHVLTNNILTEDVALNRDELREDSCCQHQKNWDEGLVVIAEFAAAVVYCK